MKSRANFPQRRPGLPVITGLAAVGLLCGSLGCSTPATPAPPVDDGMGQVAELARINGEALACQDPAAMRRAKALMLAHAPKTARYANTFDDGTQEAFLSVTRSSAGCPDAASRSRRLEGVARQLQQVLPAQATP